jgi:hypothetical protein
MNKSFLEVMSRVACDMLKSIKTVTDTETKRGVKALLLTLCRNMEDVAPRNASKAAQDRANELGIGDLRQLHFDHGSRFPGGRKKSLLHWEHWKPAADLRNELLALHDPTLKDVEAVLSSARVCWVLLEENARLNDLGYRTGRESPDIAYAEAKIELQYEW